MIIGTTLILVACHSNDSEKSKNTESPDAGVTANAEIEERLDAIISELSLEEKAAQMAGVAILPSQGLWLTPGIERFGLPGYRMTDGPRGVTTNRSMYGSAGLSPTTCFPVAMARGATFDVDLEERIGRAMGLEVKAWGGNVILAPVINILRHPAWGRAQETYGEDSYHLGQMGAAFIRGAQENVVASVKHFAMNSIENTRLEVDVRANERVLREIYLPHFKVAIDEARVGSVMTAYNSVNGSFCSENEHLLKEILKGEWGFDGFVMSDWIWGAHSTVQAVGAGLDLEMPTGAHYGAKLLRAVQTGELKEEAIDEAVRRILRKQLAFELDKRSYEPDPGMVDLDAHNALAREAATKSIVLLKNEASALPLDREQVTSIAVVGSFAQVSRTGDEGSSSVEPPYTVTPLEGFQNRSEDVNIRVFARDILSLDDKKEIADTDAAIVVVGFTSEQEGEKIDIFNTGGDRQTLDLSPEHEALIREVAAQNDRTIVVIEAGSAVTMESWLADVEALLLAWYPGQEGGNAIADVVFGHVNPSGRLPLTIPVSLDQLPKFDSSSLSVTYDYWHGYRHMERQQHTPRFPFGYGLSYTEFEYSELQVSSDSIKSNGVLGVTLKVSNVGKRTGTEVAQLYISYNESTAQRAPKELKGYARVTLEPGESKDLSFSLRAKDLAYYDEPSNRWKVEPMSYGLHLGPSSADLRLEKSFQITN